MKTTLAVLCLGLGPVSLSGVAAQLGSLPNDLTGIDVGAGGDPQPPPQAFAFFNGPAPAPGQFAARGAGPVEPGLPELDRPKQPFLANLPRMCECVTPKLTADDKVMTSDIRAISNQWCDGGDSPTNSFGLSNMVWAWGQFIDHDIVGSEEKGRMGEADSIELGGRTMHLESIGPKVGDGDDGLCGGQPNTHSGAVDGHPVYGADSSVENALRVDGSCFLLEEPNPNGGRGFLPLGKEPYKDGFRIVIVAGDNRVAEHSVLTSMHTVWMREHNRICAKLEESPRTATMPGDKKFAAAKAMVISKMQRITLEEFLPALKISEPALRSRAQTPFSVSGTLSTVEMSIAYRLGHTFIPDKIGSLSIADLFRGEKEFLEEVGDGALYKADADARLDNILSAVASNKASEMDGKMSNALRNVLFGNFPNDNGALDLCSFNIFRARDLHIPDYAGLAECMGIQPDNTTQTETPDAWVGLMREPKSAGEVLGPTVKAIVTEHFARAFFGPSGNDFRTTPGLLNAIPVALRPEVFSTSLAKVIQDNTGVTIPGGNAFAA